LSGIEDVLKKKKGLRKEKTLWCFNNALYKEPNKNLRETVFLKAKRKRGLFRKEHIEKEVGGDYLRLRQWALRASPASRIRLKRGDAGPSPLILKGRSGELMKDLERGNEKS